MNQKEKIYCIFIDEENGKVTCSEIPILEYSDFLGYKTDSYYFTSPLNSQQYFHEHDFDKWQDLGHEKKVMYTRDARMFKRFYEDYKKELKQKKERVDKLVTLMSLKEENGFFHVYHNACAVLLATFLLQPTPEVTTAMKEALDEFRKDKHYGYYEDAYIVYDSKEEHFSTNPGPYEAGNYFYDMLKSLQLACGGDKGLLSKMSLLFEMLNHSKAKWDDKPPADASETIYTFRMMDAELLYNFILTHNYTLPEKSEKAE